MATSDVRNALQVKGRLCWNPSDLSAAFPHGGIDLGLMKGHALRVRQGQHAVRAEELNKTYEVVYTDEEYIFAATIAAWDSDALTTLLLDGSAGATTGRVVIRGRSKTDGVRAGALGSSKSGVLYFSPDAKTNPGVLFYKAIPMRAETATWEFNLASQFGIPMVWIAAPDDDGNDVEVGLREDLTL